MITIVIIMGEDKEFVRVRVVGIHSDRKEHHRFAQSVCVYTASDNVHTVILIQRQIRTTTVFFAAAA